MTLMHSENNLAMIQSIDRRAIDLHDSDDLISKRMPQLIHHSPQISDPALIVTDDEIIPVSCYGPFNCGIVPQY